MQPRFKKYATMLQKKCNVVENLLFLSSCSLTFFCKRHFPAYLGGIFETVVCHNFGHFGQEIGFYGWFGGFQELGIEV